MMKNNLIFTFLSMAILGVIIGLAIGRHESSVEIKEHLKENELLREQNKKKQIELWSLRRGLSVERKKYQGEITKSIHRYDSLERVSHSRQAKLLLEIKRLKNSTVKELEDEAERIFITADTIK